MFPIADPKQVITILVEEDTSVFGRDTPRLNPHWFARQGSQQCFSVVVQPETSGNPHTVSYDVYIMHTSNPYVPPNASVHELFDAETTINTRSEFIVVKTSADKMRIVDVADSDLKGIELAVMT